MVVNPEERLRELANRGSERGNCTAEFFSTFAEIGRRAIASCVALLAVQG